MCRRSTNDPIADILYKADRYIILDRGRSPETLYPGIVARKPSPERDIVFDDGSRLFSNWRKPPYENEAQPRGRFRARMEGRPAARAAAGVCMPKPKPALNAFTIQDAAAITGLSVHMLNYLSRQQYLVPTYLRTGRRGRTRYYSYRDLVIARIVQKLLAAGLELSRLKKGIRTMQGNQNWVSGGKEKALRMLATDGKSLFFPDENGSLLDLTQNGQFAFAFVLDVVAAQNDVQLKLSPEQLEGFTLAIHPLRFAHG